MATTVVMPQLGNTVESCLVNRWLVKVGEQVDAASPLCEIETDKSTMEVPVGVAGTVLALLAAEGDDVPVKAPIAVVGEPGEDAGPGLTPAAETSSGSAAPAVVPGGGADEAGPGPTTVAAAGPGSSAGAGPGPTPVAAAVAGSSAEAIAPRGGAGPWDEGSGERGTSLAHVPAGGQLGASAVSPRARGLAERQGIDAARLAGTGPEGRVIERDVLAAAAAGPGLTRAARAVASGFVPGSPGTGLGGRVTEADLKAFTPRGPDGVDAQLDFPGSFTDTPLKGVRQIIAQRMMDSLRQSAQLTYTATAPAAGLLRLRRLFKGSDPALGLSAITIGDLVGHAAVRTLVAWPKVNSCVSDDVWRVHHQVHLGMAVDTPRGLLVPVLRGAQALSLREFSAQSKALAEQAISGRINPDLLTGGTFTVSNLGAFGVESFTPILNQPQAAILGVDAIFPRAVERPDGALGVEQRIGFSLTADHRVLDGADAARFLQALCRAVADIELTVLT